MGNNIFHYDYIIAGGGCAGLSLAYRLTKNDHFRDKSILIIDQCFNKGNDRTWCFWETLDDEGLNSLISKKWDFFSIKSSKFHKIIKLSPFSYNMIKGIDFYNFIFEILRNVENITLLENKIDKIDEIGVHIGKDTYMGKWIFTSILPYNPNDIHSLSLDIHEKLFKEPFVLQHFIGYQIKFEHDVLNENIATWMDFSVPQFNDTAFLYVLPDSSKTALFEYTIFSRKIYDKKLYKDIIMQYIDSKFPNKPFSICEMEEGIIPMARAKSFLKSNIIPIGTIGAAIKPSTGFAFSFIQKQVAEIASLLEKNKKPFTNIHSRKFQFFDQVFIKVLIKRRMKGKDLFIRIFKNNDIDTILKFLSNKSNWRQDLLIMKSLPFRIFLKSAFEVILKWK